jgi:hypothetical protein
MNKITDEDYKKILEFYKISIPKSKRILKKKAEKILAIKLCRCIKKLGVENEARSVGICTKTVLNRKGLTRGKFKCKGKQTVSFSKIDSKSKKNKSKKNKSKKNKSKKNKK